MSKQTYFFGLVVVQHPNGKYLLVNETGNRGWWLPGGRVEEGERITDAAIRETKEEAGIDVELKGILSFQHSPLSRRVRVIFYAHPKNPDDPPKSIPDDESICAEWVTLDELKTRKLRGLEPETWFTYVEEKNPIAPITMIGPEY